MLAAHRDQENLAHSRQQAPTKQQPKTPGTRYPRTPGNFGRNDENAPTAFGRKSTLGGARLGGTDKVMMGKTTGQRHAMVTPIDNRARAPLGNKTTNAKARTGQTAGVKDMVREIEKTQTKQTGGHKPKQKPVDLQPIKLNIQPDQSDNADDDSAPEPEYAPPRPTPLPYESDVLPPGGLTFNGLNKRNLLRGYYQHFHNPVDENGISRMEKNFNKEMETVLRKAEERNARDIDTFNWSLEDIAENQLPDVAKSDMQRHRTGSLSKKSVIALQQQPATISARRAVSVLAVQTDRQSRNVPRPVSSNSTTRRPLSSMISGTKPARPVVTKPGSTGNSSGEAASRTTLGYNKGRSASSMVHSRANGQSVRQRQPLKPTASRDFESELTITPARIRQAAPSHPETSKPQFMSIFEGGDDDDLPPLQKPFLSSDDEDDEFELKLII